MPRTIAHTADKRTTKKKKQDFLARLEVTASITRACKLSKVPRRSVYTWIEIDPDFAVAIEESKKIAIEALQDEAVRRAFEGTVKPVFQGGKQVGKIREYSDTLMVLLLKGNLPDKYKERFAGELSGKDGGPIKTHHTNDDIDWDKVPLEALQALHNARKNQDG